MSKVNILGCDFDGTLATYGPRQWPRIGEPVCGLNGERIIDRVKQYQTQGWKIVLWTCRSGKYLQAAVEWSRKHGLEFDAVNENIEEIRERERLSQSVGSAEELSPKIYATFYLDDKNVSIDEFIS